MLKRSKFCVYERTTNRAYGSAMRITVEQAQIIEQYKDTKRKLVRKALNAYKNEWKKNNK